MKVTEEVTEGSREHHIQHEPRLFRRKNEAGSGHARSTEPGLEKKLRTFQPLYTRTAFSKEYANSREVSKNLKKEDIIYFI